MRLFVALDIPEDVRESVAALVARLRPACDRARWVRTEGVHVTLKFIGETPEETLEAIKAGLAKVRTGVPVTMQFRGVGFFPDARRPRVLWAGIESGPELATLAGAVESALAPLHIPRETRAYSPHLTLARFDSPKMLDALRAAIDQAGPLEFGATIARNFYLYQSVLKRGGAEYTRLASYSFTGETRE
jgi:2'-5' RNA ligase